MADFKHVQGDIFDSGADALVIPVNCVGVAGKGLALEAKKRFPDWYRSYRYYCEVDGMEPGSCEWCISGRHPLIFSLSTKDHWRNPSKLEWVREGLLDLLSALHLRVMQDPRSIAIPALGCGNGGLSWADVRPLIESFARLATMEKVLIYGPKEER